VWLLISLSACLRADGRCQTHGMAIAEWWGRRSSNSVFRRLETHAGSAEAPRVAAVRNRLPAFGESAADVFLLPSQEGASDSRRSSRRAARLSPSHGAPRALPIAREVQRWSFRADEW